MAVKSDIPTNDSPKRSTFENKPPSVYTCMNSVNTPQKRTRTSQGITEPIRQSIYSSCSTLCAEDTRNMTGFERIMAATDSDAEMQLMSFINDYNELVPVPSLMASSSDDDAIEFASKNVTQARKVYFSPPPKGHVSHNNLNSNTFKQQYTPKTTTNKPGLCFNKVCPTSAPQKRVSLLSVMLQSSDSEGIDSEEAPLPKRSIKSVRKCIEFCLPSKTDYDQGKPSKESFTSLTPAHSTRIPGQRYQRYFDEGVQIW